MIDIVKAQPADISVIQDISREIWYLHYPGIITREQIEYMLDMMYSSDVIEKEMTAEEVHYALVKDHEKIIGYLAFGPVGEKDEAKLHKCYLHPDYQGKGIGQEMLGYACGQAKEKGFARILLAVNRKNEKAIKAYTKFGFVMDRPVVSDIGNGFVMDDFIMVKDLDKPATEA